MHLNSNHIMTEAVGNASNSEKNPKVMIRDGKPVVARGMGTISNTAFFMDELGELWIGGLTYGSSPHHNTIPGFTAAGRMIPLHRIGIDYTPGVKDFGYIHIASMYILMNDGTLYTWGANSRGQLGLGSTSASTSMPTKVAGNWDRVEVPKAFGYDSQNGVMYLRSADDNQWYHVGYNTAGRATADPLNSRDNLEPTPVLAPEGKTIRMLFPTAANINNTFCLTDDGYLYGIGGNSYGTLGVGDDAVVNGVWKPVLGIPQPLSEASMTSLTFESCPGHTDASSQAGGHGTFIVLDKEIYGAGSNVYNSLGLDAGTGNYTSFAKVNIPWPVKKFYCSGFSATSMFALCENGELYGWGLNDGGELGFGDRTRVALPTLVAEKVDEMYFKPSPIAYGFRTIAFYRSGKDIYVSGWKGFGAFFTKDETVPDGIVSTWVLTRWGELDDKVIHIETSAYWGNTSSNSVYAFTESGKVLALGFSSGLASEKSPITTSMPGLGITYPVRFF